MKKHYKKNPLTNQYGLHSPKKYNPKNTRPLPQTPEKPHPCSLCEEKLSGSGKDTPGNLIVNKQNPNPLGKNHYILIWKDHKEKTQNITVKEWKQLLKKIETNLTQHKNTIGYGNFGEHSGASEKHLHAHTIKVKNRENEKPQLKRKTCSICLDKTPTIQHTQHYEIKYVPGGKHGEIIIAPKQHTHKLPKKHNLAKILKKITQQYNKNNIDSYKIVWHSEKHHHIHVYPSYSAEGGLEVSGISVNRFSKKQIKKIVTKKKNKKPHNI